MTDLKDTLAALSEAATQGEWEWKNGPYFSGLFGNNEMLLYYTSNDDGVHAQNPADASFIVALVNAYRSGQLVPVPSVEVVARALCEQEILASYVDQSRKDELAKFRRIEVDCMWKDHIPAAIAVIAAMKGEGRGDG